MSLEQFFIGNNLADQSDIWQRVDICPVCVSRVVAAIMTPRGNAITRPAAERLARTIAPIGLIQTQVPLGAYKSVSENEEY